MHFLSDVLAGAVLVPGWALPDRRLCVLRAFVGPAHPSDNRLRVLRQAFRNMRDLWNR